MPWIEPLITALSSAGVTPHILHAESLAWDFDDDVPYSCLVNRVRDSTEGNTAKIVSAFLRWLETKGVTVINGSHSFTIGNSKVNQHTVFNHLGLNSPKSYVVASLGQLEAAAQKIGFPVLLKPVEGGMGKGIKKLNSIEEMLDYTKNAEEFSKKNELWLVQKFVEAKDSLVYRVWVLGNKIHCATQLKTTSYDSPQCFNSCVCTIQKKPDLLLTAVDIPEIAREEILKIMSHCQAEAGSVEFFIEGANRSYFDINMLSTLPDPKKVVNDGLWNPTFDPWAELAQYIISKWELN